jgi:glycosyltransferase involved in cell wall biosynthesis/GT2 family glycosyltransferase
MILRALSRWQFLAAELDSALEGGQESRGISRPGKSGTRRPSFSVAIPVYNAAGTIAEAVESALSQTLPPLEVVVCDDGSTDDLGGVLAPYQGRIKLVRKENGGEGSAKDAASRVAFGEFVVILDADDAFLPERLEALAELAEARPDLDILTTDAFLESGGQTLRRVYGQSWRFEVEDQRSAILERNFVFGAAAIRRERLLQVGGFDSSLRYVADWDIAIRMILTGSRAGLVDAPLYRYRVGPSALSAQRASLARGSIAVLERAATRPDLGTEERRIAEETIATKRAELARLGLDEALGGGGRSVRRSAAVVLREQKLPARTRAKAAIALVAPATVSRLQRRRTGWTGAGATFVGARTAGRLVVYTDAEQVGGAEISLGHLLAGLDPSHEVAVLGVDRRVVSRVAGRRPGTEARWIRPVRRKHDLPGVLAHVRALRRLQPALVHVNLKSPWDCPYGILAALVLRIPFVLVEHSLYPETSRLRRRFARFAAQRAAAVAAVGERSARELELLLDLPPGAVQTIYNGVPDVDAEDESGPPATPVVGCVGRLDSEKAYDTLLRALPNVDATAVIVGDGPERERLEQLAAELGIANRVRLLGWSEDPRPHLRSFTLFCLPSRPGTESFPLTIVEAMLAGLPVVATTVGSVAEAVLDGETGLLVPPNDPEALAAALRRVLHDPVLRESMGRRGRERARARFTLAPMVEGYERLYREILA